MKENDELFDVDEELTRSLERLVEEETNVAKAYVGRDDSVSTGSNVHKNVSNANLGTTQMFDSREVLKKTAYQTDEYLSDELEDDDEEELILNVESVRYKDNGAAKRQVSPYAGRMDNGISQKTNSTKNKKNVADKRKNVIIIASVISLVVIVVLLIVIFAVFGSKKNKSSYEYNYNQGMELYNSNNYNSAIDYFKVAYNTSEGKRNLELMYNMYTCYDNMGDNAKAADMLNAILDYDKNNEKALKELSARYYEQGDTKALVELINKYKGTSGEKHLADYLVAPPTASEKAGSFSDIIKLSLLAEDGCKIYYTIDGSEPTVSSQEFTGDIELSDSETVLKAIAVNELGIVSEVAEFKFEINYTKPEAPKFSFVAGDITSEDAIKIENLAEGDTAYYTLDGTTPTKDSIPYTEKGIILEVGNNVMVSAVIINKNDISSTITRNSYNVKEVKKYTYEEAVDILKSRMKSLNIIKSDGVTAVNGGTVSFSQLSKITVNDVEMYYIQCDVTLDGTKSTQGYYGVGLKNGQCYKVTANSGEYSAVKY